MNKKDLDEVREAIVGKRIARAEEVLAESHLVLTDGTRLELFESGSGCCAGADGDWRVLEGANLEAGITDIEFELTRDSELDEDGYGEYASEATITILHNRNPIAEAECYADAGNGGYYFSILSLRVRVPRKGREEKVNSYEVISS